MPLIYVSIQLIFGFQILKSEPQRIETLIM